MNLTFMHVGEDLTLPTIMVESAKELGYRVVQFTDMTTPEVPRVDQVIRKPWDGKNIVYYRSQHLADYNEPHLTVDTDIVILEDVSHVWKYPFDVALTRRYAPIIGQDGINITEAMPYNAGVIFARDNKFFKKCLDYYSKLPEEAKVWWGDQLALKGVADMDEFTILELPCDFYNYTPLKRDENIDDKYILHFKGERKNWMVEIFG